ncbi:adenylate/guanylate cyclase domain-containing protein [Legionella sp.]|uniref:adenylate/guanylate cyclase domain-containing protein n=1 Tax=Legionella sp. TaxID=459 RepID=UPI003CC043D3
MKNIYRQNTGGLNCFFFFLAVTLISLLVCLFKLKHIADLEIKNESEYHKAYTIAEKLRQNVNNLTTLSRLYISTGDKKYRDYYNHILAIRDGDAPRPEKFYESYWDLMIGKKTDQNYIEPKSLSEIILEQNFSLKELSLLLEAENKSKQLTQIEIKAMNMAEKNKKGTNTHLAHQILVNDHYMEEKANTLRPVRQFLAEIENKTKQNHKKLDAKSFRIIIIALPLAILSTLFMLFSIFQALTSLSRAKEANDLLLLNILPESIVQRLKSGEEDIADEFHQTSVMFADIINFTKLTENLGAKKTVTILNQLFAEFDNLTGQYHIEKVKTIGDNYMAVAGIPVQTSEHAINIADYALAILTKMHSFNETHQLALQFRIGITYGYVIAGVVGHKKFLYDVWGNVVNLASRLEKCALPNTILISEKMAFMLEEKYLVEPYATLTMKGFGAMKTFFLLGKKEE